MPIRNKSVQLLKNQLPGSSVDLRSNLFRRTSVNVRPAYITIISQQLTSLHAFVHVATKLETNHLPATEWSERKRPHLENKYGLPFTSAPVPTYRTELRLKRYMDLPFMPATRRTCQLKYTNHAETVPTALFRWASIALKGNVIHLMKSLLVLWKVGFATGIAFFKVLKVG